MDKSETQCALDVALLLKDEIARAQEALEKLRLARYSFAAPWTGRGESKAPPRPELEKFAERIYAALDVASPNWLDKASAAPAVVQATNAIARLGNSVSDAKTNVESLLGVWKRVVAALLKVDPDWMKFGSIKPAIEQAEISIAELGRRAAMSSAQPIPLPLSAAELDALHERRKQVHRHKFTPDHDDRSTNGELALAAISYALRATGRALWPSTWTIAKKSAPPRDDLVRATALLLAEIDRRDRAAARNNPQQAVS